MNKTPASKAIQKKISKMEMDLFRMKEKLAKFRAKLPKEEIQDYVVGLPGKKFAKLSSLFGSKKELILVHNMGSGCPYCTLWADGFNGQLNHLQSRAAFAVESPDSPENQSKFAKKRGWKFKMVSSRGSTLRKDLGYADSDDNMMPGVSVLVKGKGGKIYRASHTAFGPGDNFCNVWDLFDLLPGRSGSWSPRFRY